MHNDFQIGTLAVILFGIMLSRYDTSSLRKEMPQEIGDLRKGMNDLRKEMGDRMETLRTDVHRSTTLVTEMLFQHAGRITELEQK